jgi:3-hydroxyisobutyrate dehydrogenase
MGHLMVFNGLMGITSAIATHSECFQNGRLGGTEQGDFFDFLNSGAGGTKQWDIVLSQAIKNDFWETGFFIKYAAVDALYTAALCLEKKVSFVVIESITNLALVFSYVLNHEKKELCTQAIVREMVSEKARDLDAFILKHSGPKGDSKTCIQKCLESLPSGIQKQVKLDITAIDFLKKSW